MRPKQRSSSRCSAASLGNWPTKGFVSSFAPSSKISVSEGEAAILSVTNFVGVPRLRASGLASGATAALGGVPCGGRSELLNQRPATPATAATPTNAAIHLPLLEGVGGRT